MTLFCNRRYVGSRARSLKCAEVALLGVESSNLCHRMVTIGVKSYGAAPAQAAMESCHWVLKAYDMHGMALDDHTYLSTR